MGLIPKKTTCFSIDLGREKKKRLDVYLPFWIYTFILSINLSH